MRTLEDVKNYFTYHAPSPDTIPIHERINDVMLSTAEFLWEIIPPFNAPSPDKTIMFRALSDTRMACNLAVACYTAPVLEDPDAVSPAERNS